MQNYNYFREILLLKMLTPTDLTELKKLYYSIGEVAEMFQVNASLIRFWEKEFSSINPKKNKKGNRLFTVKDIETIQRIYVLVKVDGMTLEGAKKALKEKQVTIDPIEDHSEIINRLESIKERLLKLKH